MTGLIYLATPYSDPDPAVREKRFQVVNRVAARLMKSGYLILSPISHTHPIALAGDLPKGWEFWKRYDIAIMKACSSVLVVTQDGWRESVGVTAEIAIAKGMGLPVLYTPPHLVIGRQVDGK
jgi:hypothetical protein